MADDGRLGLTTAGQSTRESVGGSGDRAEALRHTRDLALRRVLEVAFWLLWVPLVAGPWALCWYVPWAFRHAVDIVGGWLGIVGERTRAEEYLYRGSLASIGVAVALGLLVLDDWALCWWPWRWQIPASTARGLLWPAWWRAAIPSVVIVRAVLIAGPLRAATEIEHLDQRQRQEVRMPTLSGAAYETIPAHLAQFRGWQNPYRDPNAPSKPPQSVRAIFRLPDNGNGGGGSVTRIVDCPDDVATLEQQREVANLVLTYDIPLTRPQMVQKRHIFTDPAWRAFQEWMAAHQLVEKTSSSRNASYQLTQAGHQWLRTIQTGAEEQPF